ncbi:hypothetical protein DEO72_LG2g3392 [Vigna unguiculata]|uniref:Uncharacterized protein n=1 Tax=Vigna unguiculata TaxID=3917 RepID=A0A4D6L3G2_VIGUN|nr:hypothetical protein DEO72_LG2g3392 [Vigna unguiculata]
MAAATIADNTFSDHSDSPRIIHSRTSCSSATSSTSIFSPRSCNKPPSRKKKSAPPSPPQNTITATPDSCSSTTWHQRHAIPATFRTSHGTTKSLLAATIANQHLCLARKRIRTRTTVPRFRASTPTSSATAAASSTPPSSQCEPDRINVQPPSQHHRVAHHKHRTVRRQALSEGQKLSFTSLRQKP